MATLATTANPSPARSGSVVSVVGSDFTGGATVTINVPALGFSSQIVADAAGFFGTDDIADHALTTLTSTGVEVTANDTVTIGAVTYTFKASVTTTANEVKMGGTAALTLANLKKAINLSGVGGTDYGSSTVIHPTVGAGVLDATTLKLYAKTGGTGGNSLTSTKSAVTLSFPGATFNSGTPGSAATGISPLLFAPERQGTYVINATDGTNTASTTLQVWG